MIGLFTNPLIISSKVKKDTKVSTAYKEHLISAAANALEQADVTCPEYLADLVYRAMEAEAFHLSFQREALEKETTNTQRHCLKRK